MASTDQIAAIAAFLSGVGSVLSATWYVKRERGRSEEECDKRIALIDRALHEGIHIARGGDGHDEPD